MRITNRSIKVGVSPSLCRNFDSAAVGSPEKNLTDFSVGGWFLACRILDFRFQILVPGCFGISLSMKLGYNKLIFIIAFVQTRKSLL